MGSGWVGWAFRLVMNNQQSIQGNKQNLSLWNEGGKHYMGGAEVPNLGHWRRQWEGSLQ